MSEVPPTEIESTIQINIIIFYRNYMAGSNVTIIFFPEMIFISWDDSARLTINRVPWS